MHDLLTHSRSGCVDLRYLVGSPKVRINEFSKVKNPAQPRYKFINRIYKDLNLEIKYSIVLIHACLRLTSTTDIHTTYIYIYIYYFNSIKYKIVASSV